MFQGLEIDRFCGGRALLPTPTAQTAPCEREGSDSGLLCSALVTLRLRVEPCPAGMPAGCRGPCHARVAQAGGTRPTPMDPGVHAAACGPRRDAGRLWECIGGGVALPLCVAGDAAARGTDRPSAWQGGKPGAVGMTLGALRTGLVEVGNRVQEDPELGDERLA
jgi:hypothetical protein